MKRYYKTKIEILKWKIEILTELYNFIVKWRSYDVTSEEAIETYLDACSIMLKETEKAYKEWETKEYDVEDYWENEYMELYRDNSKSVKDLQELYQDVYYNK